MVAAGTVPRNVLRCGHVLDELRTLPDGCVQSIVTSPPYFNLRDYHTEPQAWGGISTCAHVWGDWQEEHTLRESAITGKTRTTDRAYGASSRRFNGNHEHHVAGALCAKCGAWYGSLGNEPEITLYIDHLCQVFLEAGRVLRNNGTLWVNIGDSYANDTKWGGQSSSLNVTSARGGYAVAGVQQRRTGLPPKSLMNIPARFSIAMQDQGWTLRNHLIWQKPNAMPESVTDRCTVDWEDIFLFTKCPRYYFDAAAIAEPTKYGSCGSQFTTGKTGHHANQGKSLYTYQPTKNARSVWSIPTQPYAEAHFATFPPALAERMILAGSAPQACDICGAPYRRKTTKTTTFHGGSARAGHTPDQINAQGKWAGQQHGKTLKSGPVNTILTQGWTPTCHCPHTNAAGRCLILDPFSGAGTVAFMARRLGRDYVGIELNPDYVAIALERILRDTLPEAMKDTPIELIPPRLFDVAEGAVTP